MASSGELTPASPCKRGVGAVSQAPLLEGDITEIMQKNFREQEQATSIMVSNLLSAHTASSQQTMSAIVERSEQRYREQQGINANVQGQLDHSRKRLDDLEGRIPQLEAALALANQTAVSREDVASLKFDRPPNLEILRVSAKKTVTQTAVADALHPWLQEVCRFSDEQWKIVPSVPPGRAFTLKFLSNPVSNADMVSRTMGCMRDDTGAFRKFSCNRPDGSSESLRIDRDESDKMRTQRRMAAVCAKAIGELAPSLEDVHTRKDHKMGRTTIFAGKLPICTMRPTSAEILPNFFAWNNPTVLEQGIDKPAILARAMALLERPEDTVQWSL